MRKALFTAVLLPLMALAALAQTTATNGVTTLVPSFGSTAFVPNASVFGLSDSINWLDGLDLRSWGVQQAYEITAQPGNVVCGLAVQVIPTNKLWFFLYSNMPLNATSLTIKKTLFAGGPIVLNQVIPLTIAQAAPVLTATGLQSDFRDPVGQPFNGGFSFGASGIKAVTLNVSGMGGIVDWVVTLTQNGVSVEVLGRAIPIGNGMPNELLYFPMPNRGQGNVGIRASALSNPALQSNTINLAIQ